MSNIATLKPIEKGDGRGGRKPGAINKYTRSLKKALLLAAEKSIHSKDKSLESYCTYLADEKQELYVAMLSRLIPLQHKVKSENVGDGGVPDLNITMSLTEMMQTFEMKIKSDYKPATMLSPVIEQDDVEVEQGDE